MLTLKLLIVDDEAGMRKGAKRALRNFEFEQQDFEDTINFELHEASSGNETLDKVQEENFDIILLDYKLEDMNGLDVLKNLKDESSEASTIMMTAYASLDLAISATKSGVFDFLSKPFSPKELKNVVRKTASNILYKRKAKKLEENKKKVRFQFLSVLAHELKAPLNAIDSYLRILDDRVAGDSIENYDKMIKRSMERISGMRKLIFDLLDLTRIESGEKKREISDINLIEAVNRSIETNSVKAEEKGVELNISTPEQLIMKGDSNELEIMFNNLVSNAIKYNKDNGTVYINIEDSGDDTVNISVADTGIGMKPEEKERLFQEFVRFKNEKTKNIEGSGLGLSILQKLVSLYNGNIEVESEFEKGTTFHITLKKNETED